MNDAKLKLTLRLLLYLIPGAAIAALNLADPIWQIRTLASALGVALLIEVGYRNNTAILRRLLFGCLACTAILFLYLRVTSFYIQGESFNIRFFYHLDIDSILYSGSAYTLPSVIVTLTLLTAVAMYFRSLHNRPHTPAPCRQPAAIIILMLCTLQDPDVLTAIRHSWHSQTNNPAASITRESLSSIGLNPDAIENGTIRATPGKNLVLIYLESLEQIYTDDRRFPGLTPNIRRLQGNALNLTSIRQTEGTGWTIAGIIASQCGTPLLTQGILGGNDSIGSGLLSKATCLGDVLRKAGYNQSYLGGAPREFGGKYSFLASHGYQKVLGLNELEAMVSENDIAGWGLHDDALFRLAYDEFSELSRSGSPFNLTILTLDTHEPGRPSPSCPEYKANPHPTLQSIHCTDWLLGSFITKLQQHAASKDTTIVVMSDHLAFQRVSQQLFPDVSNRALLAMTLDNLTATSIPTEANHMDMADTILDILGVEHNASFLAGASILDKKNQTRQPLLTSEQKAVIRKINTSTFSRKTDICSNKPLLKVKNQTLAISGAEANLTHQGWPITLERLFTDLSFAMKINQEGEVSSYQMISNEHLSAFKHISALLDKEDDEFLLLLEGGSNGSLNLSLQSSRSAPIDSASFASLDELYYHPRECDPQHWKTDSAVYSKGPRQSCNNAAHAAVNSSTGEEKIVLESVRLDGSNYSATLVKNANQRYQVTEYRRIDDTPGLHSECTPRLMSGYLLIPHLLNENGKAESWLMGLTEPSTTTLSFRLLNREPAPSHSERPTP